MATKLTDDNNLNPCGCLSHELPADHNVFDCLSKQGKVVGELHLAAEGGVHSGENAGFPADGPTTK